MSPDDQEVEVELVELAPLSDEDWLDAITPRRLELDHTLTVFNAVDVPFEVQATVIGLLAMYDVDVYTRPCDATGKATA